MSLLGQFAAPVGAMMAQSKAMEVIGLNVSNVNTGGYKRSETNFSTLLANTYDHNNDIGGVRGVTRSMIDQQGQILSSNSDLDVAINGNGFFLMNSQLDGSGETLYGRDGTFSMALGEEITTTINGETTTTREGYLVDKNGYYIQGWPVNADQETFPTDTASLGPIRIDPETFTDNGEATTAAQLGLNVPSNASIGYSESTFVRAFDSSGTQQTFQMRWTKAAEANRYSLEILDGNTPLRIDGSGDGSPTTLNITFNGNGQIQSPTSVNISAVNNDVSFTVDMQDVTNYASNELVEQHYDYNGRSNARLESTYYNASGEIIGRFADATTRPIYKLPLATFVNPNSLDAINGNVFRVSGESSEMTVKTAGGHGAGSFVPNAREISNVDIANEFTSMILTQKAYNLGSTTFKTVDEMSQVARDLKR